MKLGTIYFVVPRVNRTGGYERQALTLARALLALGAPLRILSDCAPAELQDHVRTLPSASPFKLHRLFRQQFRFAVISEARTQIVERADTASPTSSSAHCLCPLERS